MKKLLVWFAVVALSVVGCCRTADFRYSEEEAEQQTQSSPIEDETK
jgi:hypothetical protein